MDGTIQPTTQKYTDGGSNTPLMINQPYNLLTFLSYFSPVILATIVVSSSFFYQNMKGLIYLFILIIVVIFRGFILKMFGAEKNNDKCGIVQYSPYGNTTITIFAFAFTMMYLFLPMYQNDGTNWIIVLVMITYICIDIGIKLFQGCLKYPENTSDVVGDLVGGSLVGAIAVGIMYAMGSGQNLFFIDNIQNGTTCSMPKKQTFKCNVFRNGELVSSSTT